MGARVLTFGFLVMRSSRWWAVPFMPFAGKAVEEERSGVIPAPPLLQIPCRERPLLPSPLQRNPLVFPRRELKEEPSVGFLMHSLQSA